MSGWHISGVQRFGSRLFSNTPTQGVRLAGERGCSSGNFEPTSIYI
jgi:hypothetical protein